jgi:GT2 family glycosyltransferase
MKVAVVFVIYRQRDNLEEAIASLRQSRASGVEFKEIVIDNSRINLGFTGGNNQGIRRALAWGADAVWLLNDDVKVDGYAVSELVKTMGDRGVGVVVPKIYFYPGFEFHKLRYSKKELGKVIWYAGGEIDWDNVIGVHRGVDEVDHGQFDRKQEVGFATGCSMIITKAALGKVGLLDEKYFMYLEDLDYSERIKKAGFKIIYQPKAMVWHKNAQSSGVGSGLNDYFFTRNRLLFGMAYAPLRAKFALIRESGRLVVWGRKWQKLGVVDFYLRRFGKGSWR